MYAGVGGPVGERAPEVGVGRRDPVAVADELELVDDHLVEQADDVGAGADDVALVGERPLERAGPAELLSALEHEHRASRPREIGRGGQAVVTAADDDRVPVAGRELGRRRRQADPAQRRVDRTRRAHRHDATARGRPGVGSPMRIGVGCPGSVPARAEVAIVSKIRVALFLSLVVALAVAVGCGSSDDDSRTTRPRRAPSSLDDCTPDQLQTKADGTLTVATDKPAFPPYFEDDDPTNGKGFESAVAYAIADQLGYDQADVRWTVVPFNSSYAPGPKDFDFDVNQISITPKRAEQVDFSRPYYEANQAVVALKDSELDGATSLADLAGREDRGPDRHHKPRRGQRGDPAVERAAGVRHLQRRRLRAQERAGRRVVVDVPTAFYLTAAQVPDGDDRRPVRGAGRRRVGRAAGEGLAADRLRLGGDRRAEGVRRAAGDREAVDERGGRRPGPPVATGSQ